MTFARNLRATIGVIAASLLFGRLARAEGASDEAAAEVLFAQAREAMRVGEYAKACPMLEESYRLVPGAGTRFNLAECYEHVGRTASAWAAFRDVAASSKQARRLDRAAAAEARAQGLASKLCWLTLEVSSTHPVEVRRDQDVVGRGQWGVPLPVDPGVHVIAATAPGRKPFSASADLTSCPARATVTVPSLEAENRAETAPPTTSPPSSPVVQPERARTVVAVGSLALAAVGVGLGTYFGARAWSLRDQSNTDGRCIGDRCDDLGTSLRNDARSAGTASTVAFIAGGAFLVTGVVLLLTRPTPKVTATMSAAPGAFTF